MSEPMSREQVLNLLGKIRETYPWAHSVDDLRDTDAALRAEIQAARLSESINVNERNDIIQRMQAENERLQEAKQERDQLRITALVLDDSFNTAAKALAEANKDCDDLRALAERLLAKLSEGKVMIDDIKIMGEL